MLLFCYLLLHTSDSYAAAVGEPCTKDRATGSVAKSSFVVCNISPLNRAGRGQTIEAAFEYGKSAEVELLSVRIQLLTRTQLMLL